MSRLRCYSPIFLKKIVWNRKHRTGCVSSARCPLDLLECLKALGPGERLLDLGCGTGNLRAALRLNDWNGHFIGVDISETAIKRARSAGDNNAEWHVTALEHFPIPKPLVDTISLCESIYYVRPDSVTALIERCRHSLLPSKGRIVIRIWHADRHREYVTRLAHLGAECNAPIYILRA